MKGQGKDTSPRAATSPLSSKARKSAKKLGKAALGNRDQDAATTPDPRKLKAQPKKSRKGEKAGKPGKSGKKKRRSATSRPAPMSMARRGSYWAGRKLRKHTSALTRQRLRQAAAPLRMAARAARRYGSPLLARAWRYGTRGVLNAHMALGSVRYSTIGPNWLRPLSRVFHTLTTPAARVLAWAGTLGWLNRWMYQHTSGGSPASAAASPTAPHRRRTRSAGASHRPISHPGKITAPASKGVPVGSIEHTMPLRYAAETVRNAGAMMVLNPADNMVGYESVMHALTDVQNAIGDVIRMAAMSSRENFKVNAAIPEAYDDTSVYAYALAGRLESIPTLYRIIHAEQIDNIENPTPQGAKWDQSANN